CLWFRRWQDALRGWFGKPARQDDDSAWRRKECRRRVRRNSRGVEQVGENPGKGPDLLDQLLGRRLGLRRGGEIPEEGRGRGRRRAFPNAWRNASGHGHASDAPRAPLSVATTSHQERRKAPNL